jgi:hypothetical protein
MCEKTRNAISVVAASLCRPDPEEQYLHENLAVRSLDERLQNFNRGLSR